MSGGLMNLGMGFTPQRMNSSVVKTEQEYAAEEQARQAAATQRFGALSAQAPQSPDAFLAGLAGTQAQRLSDYYATPDPSVGWAGDAIQVSGAGLMPGIQGYLQRNGADAGFDSLLGGDLAQQYRDYAGSYGEQTNGYNQQVSALGQENAAASAAAKAAADQRAQAQTVNQQAYNQQTGGGFNGGILNSSYSQPFGNTIRGMPMPDNGFTAGMMGGSGSAPAPSTGLTPFGAGGAPAGQQPASPQGWGGPFSAKNPWSLG